MPNQQQQKDMERQEQHDAVESDDDEAKMSSEADIETHMKSIWDSLKSTQSEKDQSSIVVLLFLGMKKCLSVSDSTIAKNVAQVLQMEEQQVLRHVSEKLLLQME